MDKSVSSWIIIVGVVLIIALAAIVIVLAISGAQNKKKNAFRLPDDRSSYFDGGTLQLIGWRILAFLITFLTIGIAYPWAMCMLERWEAKHTVINGRRLRFDGKGIQLLGKYLLWFLLTIITFGIFGIWFGLFMKKWKVKHTVYEDDDSGIESRFTGGAGGYFVNGVILFLLSLFTFGIARPWGEKRILCWEAKHTEIGGSALVFNGTGGQLFVKYLLLGIFSTITFGIYSIFFPVKYLKWKYSNTEALYRTAPVVADSTAHQAEANRDFAKYKIAVTESELDRMKSGLKGDESVQQLGELAGAGNKYAQYDLFEIYGYDDDDERKERAREFVKASAKNGYYKAMYQYGLIIESENKDAAVDMFTKSAVGGSADAAWKLKNIFERDAYALHGNDGVKALEMLKKSAYWFKVAIEEDYSEATKVRKSYDKMVEQIALWEAELISNNQKGSGVGAIIIAVLALILIVSAVSAAVGIIFKSIPDLGRNFNYNFIGIDIGKATSSPYTSHDALIRYGNVVGDSDTVQIRTLNKAYISDGYIYLPLEVVYGSVPVVEIDIYNNSGDVISVASGMAEDNSYLLTDLITDKYNSDGEYNCEISVSDNISGEVYFEYYITAREILSSYEKENFYSDENFGSISEVIPGENDFYGSNYGENDYSEGNYGAAASSDVLVGLWTTINETRLADGNGYEIGILEFLDDGTYTLGTCLYGYFEDIGWGAASGGTSSRGVYSLDGDVLTIQEQEFSDWEGTFASDRPELSIRIAFDGTMLTSADDENLSWLGNGEHSFLICGNDPGAAINQASINILY